MNHLTTLSCTAFAEALAAKASVPGGGGAAAMVDERFAAPGQIVVDVGINVNAEGKLCGDVLFDSVEPVVEAITPVPGGVGSVTTAVLAKHVVEAAEKTVT